VSDSYLTDWLARLTVGHTLTDADVATLGRVRLAVQNADKHHRQARDAQGVIQRLREPSEAVTIAGIEHYWDLMLSDPVDVDDVRESIRAAVAAAEQEVAGE